MAELIIFIILLVTGYTTGQLLEKKHYVSIREREAKLGKITVIASKHPSKDLLPCKTFMVAGNVVISVDFFKKFVAGLRMIVGGRVTSYETLIDRARREAILRMKQEANKLGASYIFNVKMETSSISKGKRDSIGSVEILAYGTALIPSKA